MTGHVFHVIPASLARLLPHQQYQVESAACLQHNLTTHRTIRPHAVSQHCHDAMPCMPVSRRRRTPLWSNPVDMQIPMVTRHDDHEQAFPLMNLGAHKQAFPPDGLWCSHAGKRDKWNGIYGGAAAGLSLGARLGRPQVTHLSCAMDWPELCRCQVAYAFALWSGVDASQPELVGQHHLHLRRSQPLLCPTYQWIASAGK